MARNFDGVDDHVEFGNTLSFWNFMHNTSALFTLSFWYKLDVSEHGNIVVFVGDHRIGGASIGFAIYMEDRPGNGDHDLVFTIFRGVTGVPVINVQAAVFLPKDTNYHHIVATWDQGLGSNNLSMFIDGGSEFNATKTANTPSNSNSSNEMHVGAAGDESFFYDGSIYHVAIWNSILTDTQIAALARGANPFAFDFTNMKGFYPLYGNQAPEPNFVKQLHKGEVTGAIKDVNPPVELIGKYL